MGGRPDKNKEGRPDTSDTGPIGLVYINLPFHREQEHDLDG